MSGPWIENRKQKNQEKTTKYAPLRWELKQQHRGYTIKEYNIIIDVLGGIRQKRERMLYYFLVRQKLTRPYLTWKRQ